MVLLEANHWKKTPNHQERGWESEGVARAQYVALHDSETRCFPCLMWPCSVNHIVCDDFSRLLVEFNAVKTFHAH